MSYDSSDFIDMVSKLSNVQLETYSTSIPTSSNVPMIKMLTYVMLQYDPKAQTSNGLSVAGAEIDKVFNNFFAQYSASNPIPSDATAFANAFITFANQTLASDGFKTLSQGITSLYNQWGSAYNFPSSWSTLTAANFYTWGTGTPFHFSLQEDYINNSINSADLSIISPPVDTAAMFTSAFSSFLADFSYPTTGTLSKQNFFDNWSKNNARTAVISTANAGSPPLISYEQLYFGYFPTATQAEFTASVNNFAAEQIQANGYFNPSQAYAAFSTEVQRLAVTAQNVTTFGVFSLNSVTSVTTSASKDVLIIDKVINALIAMIGSLQAVAAAQSDRLNFLSQWQKAYTDKANKIHYFLQGDKAGGTSQQTGQTTWIGQADASGETKFSTARQNLNDFNSSLTQQLQGNRQVISDQAKSVQSNVNSSTDASNQQASTVDSLLQLLSTLLSAIYR